MIIRFYILLMNQIRIIFQRVGNLCYISRTRSQYSYSIRLVCEKYCSKVVLLGYCEFKKYQFSIDLVGTSTHLVSKKYVRNI